MFALKSQLIFKLTHCKLKLFKDTLFVLFQPTNLFLTTHLTCNCIQFNLKINGSIQIQPFRNGFSQKINI